MAHLCNNLAWRISRPASATKQIAGQCKSQEILLEKNKKGTIEDMLIQIIVQLPNCM